MDALLPSSSLNFPIGSVALPQFPPQEFVTFMDSMFSADLLLCLRFFKFISSLLFMLKMIFFHVLPSFFKKKFLQLVFGIVIPMSLGLEDLLLCCGFAVFTDMIPPPPFKVASDIRKGMHFPLLATLICLLDCFLVVIKNTTAGFLQWPLCPCPLPAGPSSLGFVAAFSSPAFSWCTLPWRRLD